MAIHWLNIKWMTENFTTYETLLISWVGMNGHLIGLNETGMAMIPSLSLSACNLYSKNANDASWDVIDLTICVCAEANKTLAGSACVHA